MYKLEMIANRKDINIAHDSTVLATREFSGRVAGRVSVVIVITSVVEKEINGSSTRNNIWNKKLISRE